MQTQMYTIIFDRVSIWKISIFNTLNIKSLDLHLNIIFCMPNVVENAYILANIHKL